MKKLQGTVLVLIIWQLAAMMVGSKIFPTPAEVFMSLLSNWRSLAIHGAYSVYRLVAGVFLALVIGTPIGLLLGYYQKADSLLSPSIYVLGPIPKVALLPLIMLIFGIGNLSKIFIILIIMVFQVIIAARDAVRAIPEEYFMPYRAVKAKNRHIFLHIIAPASIPSMFTATRIGLSTSISVLFFAETFGTTWGLGFYIMDMWMRLDYRQMYLGIVALGFVGLVSVFAVDLAEKKLCPWR